MKKVLLATALFVAPFATAQAESPFTYSSSFTFASDYVFRGISQSDEGMALQGDFSVEHESGLYASLWGSTIDFNNNNAGSIEVDATVGYGFELPENIGADVGVIQYMYPGSDDSLNYDYTEFFAALDRDFGETNVSVGVNYSPEYFGKSGSFFYYSAAASMPVMDKLETYATVGYSDIDDNNAFGTPDYTDWSIGLDYELGDGFSVGLAYVDSDLDKADCADGCEARGVFTLSRSF